MEAIIWWPEGGFELEPLGANMVSPTGAARWSQRRTSDVWNSTRTMAHGKEVGVLWSSIRFANGAFTMRRLPERPLHLALEARGQRAVRNVP